MVKEPNSDKANITNLINLKGRRLQKYNLLKYRVIIAIMDYTALMNGISICDHAYGAETFSEEKIEERLVNNGIIDLNCKNGRADFNSIIGEMKLMGLLVGNDGYVSITPYLIDAYQKQTFHQILANLLAAEDSRKLSLRTLLISIIAVLVAIIALCLK